MIEMIHSVVVVLCCMVWYGRVVVVVMVMWTDRQYPTSWVR